MSKITISAHGKGRSAARIAELEAALREAIPVVFEAAILLRHAESGVISNDELHKVRQTSKGCAELCGTMRFLIGDTSPLGEDAQR